jgi:hypothetical protein
MKAPSAANAGRIAQGTSDVAHPHSAAAELASKNATGFAHELGRLVAEALAAMEENRSPAVPRTARSCARARRLCQ